MKPLKLTLHNFTCFKDVVEIDFSDLGLFAIQGATGSGKSSILDGICFALYGETSRLGATGLNALISQTCHNMSATLEFEVSGEQYRVARSKSRKASGSGNEVRFEWLQNGRYTTVVDSKKKDIGKEIEKRLGLSFGSFTKSIVLPQGKFDDFLKGNKSTRQGLLGNLIGLDKFERMRDIAQDRFKTSDVLHDTTAARLNSEFSDITPEALVSLEQQQEQQQNDLSIAEKDIVLLGQSIIHLAELKKQHKAYADAQKVYQDIKNEQPEITALKEKTQAARAVAAILPILKSYEDLNGKIEQQSKEEHDLANTHKKDVATLNTAHEAHAAAKTAHQKMDTLQLLEPLLEQKENAQYKVNKLSGEAQKILENLQISEKILSKKETAFTIAEQEVKLQDDIQRQLQQLSAAESDFTRLKRLGGSLKTTHSQPLAWNEEQWENASSQEEYLKKLNDIEKKLITKKEELERKTKAIKKTNKDLEQANKNQLTIIDQGKNKKNQFEEVKNRYEKAIKHSPLHGVIATLQLGDPCPICGTPLKTLPALDTTDLAQLEKNKHQTENELAELKDQYANSKIHKAGLEKDLENQQENKKNLEKDISELQDDLDTITGYIQDSQPTETKKRLLAGLAAHVNHLTGGVDPVSRAKQLQADLGRIQTAYQNAQKEREDTAREVAVLQGQYDSKKSSLQDTESELEQHLDKLHSLLTSLDFDLQTTAQQIKNEQGRLKRDFENTARDVQAAIKAEATSKSSLESKQAELTRTRDEQQQAHSELQAALTDSGFALDDVRAKALSLPEIKAHEQRIHDFEQKLHSAKDQYDKLEKQVSGTHFDPAELAVAERNLQAQQQKEKDLRTQIGTTGEQIRHLEKALETKKELDKQCAKAQKERNTWNTLSKALQVNAFRQFLLEDVESSLLLDASEVLKHISDGRYQLLLDDTGEYMVVDHWNADETRAVKTLSGGETFLASLSLAIALSEYLAGQHVLGALFLDEGFGTLDPNTLDAVTNALEKLQTRGRMVGVITHVASLAERLPARIVVEKRLDKSRVVQEH